MLVSELKNVIKNYDKLELNSIIVELYKRIPKYKKEEYDIDEFIKNINKQNKIAKKEEPLSFEALAKEINYFISCVDNNLYSSPNKIIPKKDRSNWRFKVKKYYKELINIPESSEDYEMATHFLINIFKRLSIGSSYLLFSNWNTFKAVSIQQSDYYYVLVKRILRNYSIDNLKECVDLLEIIRDSNELSYDMFEVFLLNLDTYDKKSSALELINEKVIELKEKLNKKYDYYIEQNYNDFVLCMAEIYFNMLQIDKGIKYFQKNYIEELKEIKEYVLLNKLEENELFDEWIKEYEKNMNKIKYRESLNEKYQKLKCKQI